MINKNYLKLTLLFLYFLVSSKNVYSQGSADD